MNLFGQLARYLERRDSKAHRQVCHRATSRVFRLAIHFALITRFIDAYRPIDRERESTRTGRTRRVKIIDRATDPLYVRDQWAPI